MSLLRVLVYSYLLFFYIDFQGVFFAQAEALPFWNPTQFSWLLSYISPPFGMYSVLDIFWKIFIVFSIFGLFSKPSKWVVILGWIVLGDYHAHFGAVTFGLVPVLSLLLFFCFVEDRRLSLDRLFFKVQIAPVVSAEPILWHSTYFLSLYFISAIQKIRMTAGHWIFGESFLPIVENAFGFQIPYSIRWLPGLLILALELLAPFALARRWVLVIAMPLLGFHLFNKLVFDIRSDFWVISLFMLIFILLFQNENRSSPKSDTIKN